MSRIARQKSSTGYYHVILRGVAKQIIFEDRSDRFFFINIMKKYITASGQSVVCYCLMENHVHLLIYDRTDAISLVMQKIGGCYSMYFNNKYDRTGHLFQNRFLSEVVENDRYLVTVFRYILNNPPKAGICAASEYEWSSYGLYGGRDGFIDTSEIERIIGGPDAYESFIAASNEDDCLEYTGYIHDDQWVERRIREILGVVSGNEVKAYDKKRRNAAISQLRSGGLTIKQIERHTGISRGVIQKLR